LENSNDLSSSKGKLLGNSSKRSNVEFKSMEAENAMSVKENPDIKNSNIDNIANQIVIETTTPSSLLNETPYNRLDYIKFQRNNRYSSSNCPPYLVHVESLDCNIGNFHPMNLGKVLAEIFPAIINIKRRGRNLIVINVKFSFDEWRESIYLDKHLAWELDCVHNYKIYKIFRTGIVRGVDLALSPEEIHKGIKFMDRPIEIKSITRLKFRDKNNNNIVC